MSVECIKASDVENAGYFTGITLDGNFTQPSVGGTMQRTIVQNLDNVQTLTIGGIYSFVEGPTYSSHRIGIYRLDIAPNFNIGTQLTFTRISSDLYDLPPERDLTTVTGSTVSPIDMSDLDKMFLSVDGCTFDSLEPITYQLPYPQTLGNNKWDNPSILIDYECIISNNRFIGGAGNIYCGSTAANHKATVITGNTFYTFSITNTLTEGHTIFVEMRKSNVLIANNNFICKETRSVSGFIAVGGHEILIKNNIATVQQPSSFGSGGVDARGGVFIVERNNGPWRIVAQDNLLKDLEHYGFSNHIGHVGSYYGNIRSNFSINDSGASTTIRLGTSIKSLNGQQWYLNITNNGELEVFQ
jgi:hypothetical protein